MLTADQLRQKYINFFSKRGHCVIPHEPLVQIDDVATSLFTIAGMQPLIPYLKGKKHPLGSRLVNIQPCLRVEDIEQIGDNHHTTFFEMLGNWSLGDYYKKEQLSWIFQFLTQELQLDPNRLYVSVFAGNKHLSVDEESIHIWQQLFKNQQDPAQAKDGFDPSRKIYTYGHDESWWSRSGSPENMPPGEIGGPDSEIFYDFGPEFKFHENSSYRDQPCHPNCGCGRFLEIGNSVFIEYQKMKNNSFKELSQKNIDFGGGLERMISAAEHQPDLFLTSSFSPLINFLERETKKNYQDHKKEMRVIVDHLRAATFLMAEGLKPSNKQQGYVLRRLLRRSIIKFSRLSPTKENTTEKVFSGLSQEILIQYKNYFSLEKVSDQISQSIKEEILKFQKTLEKGMREFRKAKPNQLNADFAFNLHQTYGFPIEISQELFQEKNKNLSIDEFRKIKQQHRDLSRTSSAGMFKGGLADHQEKTVRLHTATHLLHQALRQLFGDKIKQSGSNITPERGRFDFTYPKPLSEQEIQQLERLINSKISQKIPVTSKNTTYQQAVNQGALAFFRQKYPEKVSVYSIGDFSKEVCAGPHVKNTSEIGKINIYKQKSLGQGLRRLYFKVI